MAVTDYSSHRWGDPDVAVLVTYDGQSCPGFIDARRRKDGQWQALVRFTAHRDGYPHTRRLWFDYDDRELVEELRQHHPGG